MINDNPGPELDVEVARLLGWYLKYDPKFKIDFWHSNSIDYSTSSLDFSRSWSGMQLVVEEMQRRGQYLRLRTEPGYCEAVFVNDTSGKWKYTMAETAPHAVALAALKALEDSPC